MVWTIAHDRGYNQGSQPITATRCNHGALLTSTPGGRHLAGRVLRLVRQAVPHHSPLGGIGQVCGAARNEVYCLLGALSVALRGGLADIAGLRLCAQVEVKRHIGMVEALDRSMQRGRRGWGAGLRIAMSAIGPVQVR